jgi:hypothetical protein
VGKMAIAFGINAMIFDDLLPTIFDVGKMAIAFGKKPSYSMPFCPSFLIINSG